MALEPEDQALIASLTKKVLYLETVVLTLTNIVQDKFKLTRDDLRQIRLNVARAAEEEARLRNATPEEILRRHLDEFEGTEQ